MTAHPRRARRTEGRQCRWQDHPGQYGGRLRITKGEKCDSYKACVALLKDGKEIQYKGQTSIGAFNDAHDPELGFHRRL